MGVTKTVIKEGSGPTPKVGDKVTIDYTGYLKDASKPDQKGAK
jgi:FK506-binding protein 1